MKLKYEITKEAKRQLELFKDCMLLVNTRKPEIFFYENLKIEEEIVKYKTKLTRTEKTKTKYYVTNIEFIFYFYDLEIIGDLTDKTTIEFLRGVNNGFNNIEQFRKGWLILKNSLKGFGFKLTSVSEKNTEPKKEKK